MLKVEPMITSVGRVFNPSDYLTPVTGRAGTCHAEAVALFWVSHISFCSALLQYNIIDTQLVPGRCDILTFLCSASAA